MQLNLQLSNSLVDNKNNLEPQLDVSVENTKQIIKRVEHEIIKDISKKLGLNYKMSIRQVSGTTTIIITLYKNDAEKMVLSKYFCKIAIRNNAKDNTYLASRFSFGMLQLSNHDLYKEMKKVTRRYNQTASNEDVLLKKLAGYFNSLTLAYSLI